MTDYDRLLEKLRRIEALHAGATTPGERTAAAEAQRRIINRLGQLRRSDPPVEYRFSMENVWSRKLFVALARRYGLEPYRYYRQRYTTVMLRVPVSFVKQTLWPEFQALNEALREHLDTVAEQLIREAVAVDTSEATEVRGELPDGEPAPPASGSADRTGVRPGG